NVPGDLRNIVNGQRRHNDSDYREHKGPDLHTPAAVHHPALDAVEPPVQSLLHTVTSSPFWSLPSDVASSDRRPSSLPEVGLTLFPPRMICIVMRLAESSKRPVRFGVCGSGWGSASRLSALPVARAARRRLGVAPFFSLVAAKARGSNSSGMPSVPSVQGQMYARQGK